MPHRRSQKCYDLPVAYDLNLLHDEVLSLVDHLSTCHADAVTPHWLQTPSGSRSLRAMHKLPDDPLATVYVIVEGFIILAEPALVHQYSQIVWLQTSWREACARRYRRQRKKQHEAVFRQEYQGHIHAAYESCLALYKRNVAHKRVHYINGDGDRHQVLSAVRIALHVDQTELIGEQPSETVQGFTPLRELSTPMPVACSSDNSLNKPSQPEIVIVSDEDDHVHHGSNRKSRCKRQCRRQ